MQKDNFILSLMESQSAFKNFQFLIALTSLQILRIKSWERSSSKSRYPNAPTPEPILQALEKATALGLGFISCGFTLAVVKQGMCFRHPYRNNQMTIGNDPQRITWGKSICICSSSKCSQLWDGMAWKQTKQTRPLPGTEILCMCCYLQCMPRHSWAPEPSWRAN